MASMCQTRCLTVVGKLLLSKFAQRLEHQEPGFAVGIGATPKQVLLDKREHLINDRDWTLLMRITHRFRRIKAATAVEDPKYGEEQLVSWTE
jgi:hypothetical protein